LVPEVPRFGRRGRGSASQSWSIQTGPAVGPRRRRRRAPRSWLGLSPREREAGARLGTRLPECVTALRRTGLSGGVEGEGPHAPDGGELEDQRRGQAD